MYRFVVSSSPMLDTTSKLWFARVFMHTPLHLVTSQPCLSRIVWQLLQLQTHLCPTNESTCIETYGEGWQRHKLTHLWFIQLLFFMTICPLLRNHTTPYSRCFLRSGKPWNRTTDYLQSTESHAPFGDGPEGSCCVDYGAVLMCYVLRAVRHT